jgi:hypothetical protein
MSFTRDWQKSRLLDHSKFKEQPGYSRSIMEDIEERLTSYLYGFATGETYGGIKKITLVTIPTGTGPGSGTIPTGTGVEAAINVQGETIDGKVELITIDADGNELQLTSKGNHLRNNTFLKGTNYAGTAGINILKIDTGNGAVMGVYLSLIDDDLSNAFAAIGTGTPFGATPDGSVPADNLALPLGYFTKKVTDGLPVPSIASLPAAGTGNAGTLYLLKGSGTGVDRLYISKNVGSSTYGNQLVGIRGNGQTEITALKSTTSTSYADINGLAVTITTYGGNVLVTMCAGGVYNNAVGPSYFKCVMDAIIESSERVIWDAGSEHSGTGHFSWLFTNVLPGSHAFKIQWKATNGTLALNTRDGSNAIGSAAIIALEQ